MNDDDLLARLIEKRFLSGTSAKLVSKYAEKWRLTILRSILECHVLNESDLADAIADCSGLERIYSINQSMVDFNRITLFDLKDSLTWEVLPVLLLDREQAWAVADPFMAGIRVKLKIVGDDQLCIAEPSAIQKMLVACYPYIDGLTSG